MTKRHRRARSERGVAAFEFALIAPLMLALVMGTIDFGWMLMKANLVNNVARDAARVASLSGTYADVSSTATTELTAVGISPSDVVTTITCTNTTGSQCTGSAASYNANATSGSKVLVTISYTHEWVTPFGALCGVLGADGCVGDTILLRRVATMVRE